MAIKILLVLLNILPVLIQSLKYQDNSPSYNHQISYQNKNSESANPNKLASRTSLSERLLDLLYHDEQSSNSKQDFEIPILLPPPQSPSQFFNEILSRRLFNTTMNYIIPMFGVLLPLHTDTGSTVHLAMQAFLGLFSAVAWIATVAIPLLLTGLSPLGLRTFSYSQRSFISDEPDKSWWQRSLFTEDASRKIGLDWEKCVRKSICEAHRNPKKYGLLSLPFLILFPPSSSTIRNVESRRDAAGIGKYTKEDCQLVYTCFFDVMDLLNLFRQKLLPTRT